MYTVYFQLGILQLPIKNYILDWNQEPMPVLVLCHYAF